MKLSSFLNPLNTIYIFCILFGEQEEYFIDLENGITLKYSNTTLDVLYKSNIFCSVSNTKDFKKIITSFISQVLLDLTKHHFKGMRLKRTIVSFMDDLIQYFFNQKMSLYIFVKNVSEAFKQHCGYTNTTFKSEKNLSDLIEKFAKNTLELSDFAPFYHLLCTKLIMYMHSSDSIEAMDEFLKSYNLN